MLVKTRIAGLVMAVMALSFPLAYADSVGQDKGPSAKDADWHHGQQDHMTAQILNLTEDQEKQLKDLRDKNKEAMKSVFKQMKANRTAFETEIVKATSDMNKVNDLQTQVKALQSQMVDNRLNSILEIKKILTPEQFAGWMALEKQEDMMKHKGHDKFGHKNWSGKDGEGNKHWGDKSDKNHDPDDQD
jgi:Spy/CpxP family protein refolding chaperone